MGNIASKAAVNMEYILCGHVFSFLSGNYLRDLRKMCASFLKKLTAFQSGCTILHSTSSMESCFSTFSSTFVAVSFTCGLIHSSTDIRHLFIHLLLHAVPFFDEVNYSNLLSA